MMVIACEENFVGNGEHARYLKVIKTCDYVVESFISPSNFQS